jgi:hypothetical protein
MGVVAKTNNATKTRKPYHTMHDGSPVRIVSNAASKTVEATPAPQKSEDAGKLVQLRNNVGRSLCSLGSATLAKQFCRYQSKHEKIDGNGTSHKDIENTLRERDKTHGIIEDVLP